MKLTDRPINIQFGGGCPICKGDNTLTLKGNLFKRRLECTTCGSKFVSRFAIGSPKCELTEGSSEYLGKILHLGDWKKLRKGEIDKTEIENIDKKIKEFAGTEKIIGYLTAILGIAGMFVVLMITIIVSETLFEGIVGLLILTGFHCFFMGCLLLGTGLFFKFILKM